MKIKISQDGCFSLIEILAKNGNTANPQNPIDEASELKNVEFPEASGQLAIVCGWPATVLETVILHYKDYFDAISVVNPKLRVAFVVHSLCNEYKLGQKIPIAY